MLRGTHQTRPVKLCKGQVAPVSLRSWPEKWAGILPTGETFFSYYQSCVPLMHWGFSPPADTSQCHCILVRPCWHSVMSKGDNLQQRPKKKSNLHFIFLKNLKVSLRTLLSLVWELGGHMCFVQQPMWPGAKLLWNQPLADEQEVYQTPCSSFDLAWGDT